MAHCLIVDDSHVMRAIARRLFEDLHFTTSEAEDGIAGLRATREKMPDLIMLDWSMPAMGGVDFVRSLRAQPDGERPLILACLTQIDPNEIALGVAAGIDDYLLKPFDRDILSAKLADMGAGGEECLKSAAAG
jgi:two-component system chemotaxis response regulator CheY